MTTSPISSANAGQSGAASSARFLVETGVAGQIAALVEPSLVDLGFRLVRIRVGGSGDGEGTLNLQIMCERPDGTMTIEDCETVSRQLSPLLDASEPIQSAYRLEISSPGIDRPLVRPSDFEDWAGYEARVELTEPVNGRKRFKGLVDGFEDGEARIACDLDDLGVQVLGFPVALIAEARLVLSDDLVRETLRRVKAAKAQTKARGRKARGGASTKSAAEARAGGRGAVEDATPAIGERSDDEPPAGDQPVGKRVVED